MDAILDALRSDDPDLPDVDEKIRRFIALAREVPPRCGSRDPRRTGCQRTLTREIADERERILYQAVKDFRLAARNVIGNRN
ncbi:hypothetical protein [Streptomyces sp. TRM70350]|uniref:hypothetical protein n=1 Tax=Streptomyces sp. TRM70350 TaxID=2856165 RepID=UPI001C475ED8|nr:hypothetical protein [Streptomyces sp. TRM70350]MBV7698615.1 hypothetical protein [Streptomyces sp. TRM70350]